MSLNPSENSRTSIDNKIADYYQLARTALAGGDTSRHARMVYVQKNLAKEYPLLSSKKLWLLIDEKTRII